MGHRAHAISMIFPCRPTIILCMYFHVDAFTCWHAIVVHTIASSLDTFYAIVCFNCYSCYFFVATFNVGHSSKAPLPYWTHMYITTFSNTYISLRSPKISTILYNIAYNVTAGLICICKLY